MLSVRSKKNRGNMRLKQIISGVAVFTASAALAHDGVQNPAVMARMHGMAEIAAQMKRLGDMVKGTVPFDATVAREASAGIADHAAQVPGLFRAEETDPKSEALPAIWDDFADFSARSDQLAEIASGFSTAITQPADLGPALAALGATCRSCHQIYRK